MISKLTKEARDYSYAYVIPDELRRDDLFEAFQDGAEWQSKQPTESSPVISDKELCEFSEWIDINGIRNGPHEWKWRGDNFKVNKTTSEMLTLYRNQLNK